MKVRGGVLESVRSCAKAAACAATAALLLLGGSGVARAQAPIPAFPPDGHAFAWEDVDLDGVTFEVHAPPDVFAVRAEVSRAPDFSDYPESVWLDEVSSGRYRGGSLDGLYDEIADPGRYYWRPVGASLDGVLYGPVRTFTVKGPYRAPSLRIAARRKVRSGERFSAAVLYRPGSESPPARIHLLAANACPDAPVAGGADSLIADGEPPPGGRVAVALRRRALGPLRLCAYATAESGAVMLRAERTLEVVRRPASPGQMRGWRMSARGLGPIRIGMTVGEVERVTGRSMVLGYGDHPGCQIWQLRGAPGLSLMRAHGRIARVQAYRGSWRTTRGIGIGSSEREVRARYGRVHEQPHTYVDGKYLIVGPPRGRLIFETGPDRRVMSFRGGRAPYVGYVEGCV